jgi:hypothetical protein
MSRFRYACVLAGLLVFQAHAADLLGATYEPVSDTLLIDIAYRGTHPEHDFFVQWSPCSGGPPARTVGRVIDVHGRDAARENFRVRERVSLENLPCRPALVTLRLGRVAHEQVFVPEAPTR